MKGINLSQIMGTLVAMLGLTVMFGWYAHIAALITLFPGYNNIVFNSALGFFLSGVALLIPGSYPTLQKNSHIGIGAFVALMAFLTLMQNISGYSVGIDQVFMASWLPDQDPYPGRMADNSSLAFMFSGLAFILLPYVHKKMPAAFAQVFIFTTLILGFSALAGYLFNMRVLYDWTPYAHMSLQSSVGNSLLGVGLWALWNRKTNVEELSPDKEEKRIISLSATIAFCVVLICGIFLLRMDPHISAASTQAIHSEVEPTILICALVGMAVLLWQLFPFVRQLLRAERKLIEANALIKESENRFRSAFDYAAIGMALISIQGKFLRVNQSLCYILGYSEKELLTINPNQIIHLEDLKNNKAYIEDMLDGRTKSYQSLQRYFHKNGEVVWISLNMSIVANNNGEPLYFIAQLQNITSEKKAEEQLRHLAYFDPLTGLYNRNSLDQKLQEMLASARRNEKGFSLVFLDLDRFKNINDTIGHDAGDMVLQIVAQRLKNTVRNTDALARVGGDEFIIVLSEMNKVDQITSVVRKIISNLQQRIVIKGQELYVMTSIGVSVYPYDGTEIATLTKNADLALYRAKELGRNNYQFCTPEMTSKAQEKMSRQNAVIQALAKNEFELYYQPKLELATQTISGVEALLRWRNPEYSHINASEIIQLAEETGLILSLNEWVIKTACEQVSDWHNAGFLRLNLAVNLSALQFKQANFVEYLMALIEKTEFPSECLELEITETLIMQDPEYILNMLHALKEHGIGISIDDFGTGYSSLNTLSQFPFDYLKIDRTFIRDIKHNPKNLHMISMVIALGKSIGFLVIIEGIETIEQFYAVKDLGCKGLQGFLLSQPLPVDALEHRLRQGFDPHQWM